MAFARSGCLHPALNLVEEGKHETCTHDSWGVGGAHTARGSGVGAARSRRIESETVKQRGKCRAEDARKHAESSGRLRQTTAIGAKSARQHRQATGWHREGAG